jgi:hypothetical protein
MSGMRFALRPTEDRTRVPRHESVFVSASRVLIKRNGAARTLMSAFPGSGEKADIDLVM